MGLLQREYGITRQEALWDYSYEELQDLIRELPTERIVKVYGKETKADIERKWLESIADFDSSQIKKDKDSYDHKVKVIELKSKIKKQTDPTLKEGLERQLVKLQGD